MPQTLIHEHEHPLKLIDLQPNYPLYEEKYDDDDDDDDNGGGELVTRRNFRCRQCDRCREEISWFHRYYYECAHSCDYSLHKFCRELPITLKHTSHPAHTLTLFHLTRQLFLFHDIPRCFCVLCGRNDAVGLCYYCSGCDFIIHGNCAIASVEDRLIYHPSHRHPLAATPKPHLSECNACGKKHEGTFYICTTCFGLFIHSDCAFLPENLIIQNATNDIFSHPHPLILSYSFPFKDQRDQYYPKCRVCEGYFYRSPNTWIYKCEKCRYYAHIPCATLNGAENRLVIKNYEDSEYPDLLHLPFPDESYSIPKHMFAKLVEHGTFGADEGNYVNHNFHPHPLMLVHTECNDTSSTPSSSKTNVLSCHNPMKKVQLLCNACVRPVTSVPFYKCVNDDCNFVLHEWCATQLPTQVEKYPGHPKHTLILHSNAPNKFLSVFKCKVCELECNGFVYSCVECDYHIDVACSFIPQNITHEAHSGHLLSFRKRYIRSSSCLICKGYVSRFQCAFGCDTCEDVGVHVGCALLLPGEIRHKIDKKHPMRLSYLPAENHKSEYFCEICEEALNPEKCFYHCYECAWSIHTYCAPHILQSETATSNNGSYDGDGPYKFVNIKFGGIHKFESRRHPHPLSFVQWIQSDGPCNKCGYAVKYQLILKCQQCKFVIDFFCCRRYWRKDEIVEEI